MNVGSGGKPAMSSAHATKARPSSAVEAGNGSADERRLLVVQVDVLRLLELGVQERRLVDDRRARVSPALDEVHEQEERRWTRAWTATR